MKVKRNRASGISALPTILLLSGIILEVVVAGLAVAQFFNQSLLSEQLSIKALRVAESGAHDAISRVNDYILCPDYTSTGPGDENNASYYCPSLYEFAVSDDLPDVCVSIGEVSNNQMTIYSRGRALTRYKTIEVVLGITTTTATVGVQSFKEIETPSSLSTSCDS